MPADLTVTADHVVCLRRHVPEDAERLAVLLNDPDVTEMTASVPYPYGRSDAEAFLSAACHDDGRTVRRAIDWQGVLVGSIGLGPRPGGDEEIGYWVGKPFWGQGIATRAVAAFLGVLDDLRFGGTIKARTVASNLPSQRVLERNGFVYTGEGECVTPAREAATKPAKLYVLERPE